jgi:hypothetical protein
MVTVCETMLDVEEAVLDSGGFCELDCDESDFSSGGGIGRSLAIATS